MHRPSPQPINTKTRSEGDDTQECHCAQSQIQIRNCVAEKQYTGRASENADLMQRNVGEGDDTTLMLEQKETQCDNSLKKIMVVSQAMRLASLRVPGPI